MANKKFWLGMLVVLMAFGTAVGCASSGGSPATYEELTSLASVPQESSAATEIEGVWLMPPTKSGIFAVGQNVEFTFVGNQFIRKEFGNTSGGSQNGMKGTFTIEGNNLVLFVLSRYLEGSWRQLPYQSGRMTYSPQKFTYGYNYSDGKITLNGENVYTKTDFPTNYMQ